MINKDTSLQVRHTQDRRGKIIAALAAVRGVNKAKFGKSKKAVLIIVCRETLVKLLQRLLGRSVKFFIEV